MKLDFKDELIERLLAAFGDRLESVILYGTEDSDVDIAVILENANDAKVRKTVSQISAELDLGYSKMFSIINIDVRTLKEFRNVLPFYRNVLREGVALWKKV